MKSENGSIQRTFLIVLATIGALALLTLGSCAALLGFGIASVSKSLSGSSNSKFISSSHDSNINFTTPVKGGAYIAGIKFDSEIQAEYADDIIAKLQYAAHDSNAVGILLEVDSPGGVVVPSQEIYDAVKEVAATKPVVSYVRSMAASGAYYAIAPSTEIVASRGALIGSIGVIMNGYEINELLKFLKIQPHTIKSGALKDAGSTTRPMTAEDKEYLKGLVDELFAMFLKDIKTVRTNISQKDLNFMSDGRVVLAPEAQKLQLIDLVGSKEVAKNELVRIAKLKNTPDVFYYEDIKPFADFFTERFVSGSSKLAKEFVNQSTLPR